METTVQTFAMEKWVTRALCEDSAIPVEQLLQAELRHKASEAGGEPLDGTFRAEWRDVFSDPMAMTGTEDGPMRQAWNAGDLFLVRCAIRCTVADAG